jgi:Divergent InlB B-repeat domain
MGFGLRWRALAIRLSLTALAAPCLLGSAEAGTGRLTASWLDNSNGMAATSIERRLTASTAFETVADVPAGVTAYVDTSVAAGTSYCYRAFAHDADGVSPYTDEVCATATPDLMQIAVTKAGTGAGTVATTPAGISCGTVCTASFPVGTVVTLTATPAAGSTFAGWSGGCAGTAPCTVSGNGSVAVTATFSAAPVALSVARSGPGAITSAPSGISCGTDCSETYASGTIVTLTATPSANGSTFVGWSGGGCSGSVLTCTVTLKTATTVTAMFKHGKAK